MPEMENRKDMNLQKPADAAVEDIPVKRAPKPAVEPAEGSGKPVQKKPAGDAAGKTVKRPETTGAAAPKKSAAQPKSGAAAKSAGVRTKDGAAEKATAKPSAAAGKTGGEKNAPPQKTAKPVKQPEPAEPQLDLSFEDEPEKKGIEQLLDKYREWKANRPEKKPLSKKAALRRKRRIRKIIRRSILCVFSALLVVVFGVYMVLFTVFNGPSPTAADLLVNTLLETSALKFVPRLYYSEAEVQEIIARNAVVVQEAATDTSMVVINRTAKAESAEDQQKDIEIVEVNGATYHGYMMIVKDPARVGLAVSSPDFDSEYGKYLDEMAVESGAVAAINAGGFKDEGGSGKGGKPLGIVIKDNEVLNSSTSGSCSIVIGFDQEDKLIVGKLTAKEAVALGMRDAASFGPILVLNGEPAQVRGSSSGLNPRTAIGQRADGSVLLLVIDGRQANSLGASMADLIDVMMQFEAVNAANLDGGSSSKMWYQGEFVNDGVALTGSRRLPTAFIVK